MKKLYLSGLIILFLMSNLVVAQHINGLNVTSGNSGYTIDFSLPEYSFQRIDLEQGEFTKLILPDYGTTTDIGYPALPQISFNLSITSNDDVKNISVSNLLSSIEILQSPVYPFQEPWPRNKPLKERPFSFNTKYYSSTGDPNAPLYKISEPYVIGGVKGVTITIYPFAFNPVAKQLKVVKHATFTIELQKPVERVNGLSDSYNLFLKSFFQDYKAGSSKSLRNYLIITAPEYEAGLAPFIAHKNGLGYNITLVTTTVTGTTTTAIKTYIQNLYANPTTKPEFILLVGDTDKIPAWTGSGTGSPRTDLNYVLLEGTDYYADAFIGRFSIASPSQLQNAINKTIYMENYIGTFEKKNVYMASEDNYSITEGTHNFVIDNYFQPSGYSALKLYTHTYNATTQQLVNALNANQVFAIYSGHGAETYWADGPVLNQSQVNALTNTVFPFVYSFSCITGSYHIAESFGETWLRAATGGVTFYGSSVNSYWDEDDILERRIFKSMYDEGISKVTPMFDRGKYLMVQHFGGSVTSGSMMLRYLEMYNLMGDPSIETKKVIPPDTTPPDPVTNLAVTSPTSNSLTLTWTAPYDSTFGGIAAYDIRYSTSAINDGNFNTAPRVVLPMQSDSAGTPKSLEIDSLAFSTQYYFAIKALDLWGNTSPISNIATASTWGAPQILVTPNAINKQVPSGVVVTDTIRINNVSPHNSTLDYSVVMENNNYPNKIQFRIIPLANNTENSEVDKDYPVTTGGQSIEGLGGPDAFGYQWIDSDELQGPVYEWNDIAATGTPVTNWIATGTFGATDEGYSGPYNLGFNFKFYGQVKTQFYLSSNGFISFAPITANAFSNASIPTAGVPNEIICPFWDDLDAKSPGTVHYKQDGNKIIIQWTNYQRYSGTSSYTWQVHLYSSGKILVYYNTMTGTINSATIGIENSTGTVGLQVAKDANYIKNNLALKISADPEWVLTNSPLAGTLHNGNTAAIEMTFKSEDFPLGTYSMDIVVNNNSGTPVVTVPLTMVIAPIPVELTSFTVEPVKDNVLLTWTTATETNNSGFSIERKNVSADTWTQVSFIDGKGTTTEATSYTFTDKNLKAGSYEYRLKQIDFDGTFSYSSVVKIDLDIPANYVLEQNYPNPFNPSTTIKFGLPADSQVKINIFNSIGEKVAELINSKMTAGYHTVNFDASNLTSGIYFYQIKADNFESIKKMMLIK